MKHTANVIGGLALAIGISVAVLAGAAVSTRQMLSANRWVSHTHVVLERLDDLLVRQTDAETGQRGFLLTGERRFLEPYTAALAATAGDLAALRDLTSDNPAQQRTLDDVQRLSDAKLAELRQTIDLYRTDGPDAALRVVRTERGKRIMDDLRGVIARMQDREQSLLLSRTAAAKATAVRVILTLAATSLVASLLAVRLTRPATPAASAPVVHAARSATAARYAFAVAAPAVAGAVHWGLAQAFGPVPRFITFYPAVVIVAGLAGAGPAFVATAVSSLVLAYFFLPPLHAFAVGSDADLLGLAIFAGTTFFISVLGGRLQQARSARAVTRQQELLAVTLVSIGDGVIVTDTDGRVTFLNPVAEAMTGWPLAEAVGRPLPSVFHAMDESSREDVESLADKAGRANDVVGAERHTLLVARDGREIPVEDSVARVREVNGVVTGNVLVFRDVSDRRAADAARRDGERRFRTLADAITQLAWTARADGFIDWYNRRWYEYTGTAPGDMDGWGWQAVHDPETLPEVMRGWTASIATGQPFEMVFPLRRADGQFRTFLTRVEPSRDAGGRVVGWFGTNTDIEDLRRAEEARGRLAAIVESSDDAILSKRLDGTILTWNAAAERLFGYPADEVVGRPITLLVPPDRLDEERDMLARLARGEPCEHIETVRVCREGRRIDVSLTISPIRDATGRVIGASKIARDITDRKRAQAAVTAAVLVAEEARGAAEAANRAKDHFIAVLSHELRTPLNPVLATATMLLADPRFDADVRGQLDVIVRNVEFEACLIDDLLDVTRIQRGKVELNREPVDLAALLRLVADTCRGDAAAKGLTVTVDVPATPCGIDGDAARLRQVFWNLFRNAVKFTPAGGTVSVRGRRDADGSVAVTVADDGVGIDPAAIGKIFDAFEQADASVTKTFGGLGLGLTISRAMVELHGGTVTAASGGPGRGATFEVRLPAAPAAAVVASPPPPRADRAGVGKPLRILLVEDHADTARVMARLLRSKGHRVEHAADVATSLSLLHGDPFDLLLSDLGLPDGSGWDIMRNIRSQGSTLPGIALSGYGQEADVRTSLAAGYAAHLTKPVNLALLIDTIGEVGHATSAA